VPLDGVNRVLTFPACRGLRNSAARAAGTDEGRQRRVPMNCGVISTSGPRINPPAAWATQHRIDLCHQDAGEARRLPNGCTRKHQRQEIEVQNFNQRKR
jgi:hypothetical protein